MKKVLQVVGQLRIGGAETVAMNLYRYIDREVFEFHYLVYGDQIGEYEDEVIRLGGRVIHIDYSVRNLGEFKKKLKEVIIKNGPYDAIHSHMMFHNGIVLECAKKCNVPIRISHSHSTDDGANKNNFKERIVRNLYDFYCMCKIKKNANFYLACGKDAGEFLYGKKLFEREGIIINNGIDTDKFVFNNSTRQLIRGKYGLVNNHVYACIGHFDRVKNHIFLMDVFREIVKRDDKAIMVLLGDGELRSSIKKMCDHYGISEKVLFMGNVNNVSDWLQAIDFLLMPSLFEGIPVTLIEAQTADVKCFVSTNVSREVNYTNKIKYLSLNDKEGWINICYENAEYERVNCKSYTVKSGYDVKESVNNVKKIYMEMEGK